LLLDEGCTEITGKLSIVGVEFDKTTPALDTLTAIGGSLNIVSTIGLTSLGLFASLQSVGGSSTSSETRA
jgi:hypothetical protein